MRTERRKGLISIHASRQKFEKETIMTAPTPVRTQSYEKDEYPEHTPSDVRLFGSDNLCYGILFGGLDCYPDVKKIRDMQAFIPHAVNAYETHQACIDAQAKQLKLLYNRNAMLVEALEVLTNRATNLDFSATHEGIQNCDALVKARKALAAVKGE
jgi:hypothetical protein